ncbi:serine hydrolase domain-containing protein [Micromonospora cathayae]|uniref:Serine hydrolase n=1 Tax=Micromonospora cathayae TaxID=3028804 RepID=A0ABY7ZIJ9_9ACTN|nr:serine hydrolase domain-containing protein [Micromonospora sp. HUAS 3]WDZ82682.1 serine hydrolase [Micromonospora sp. HUAS 3]
MTDHDSLPARVPDQDSRQARVTGQDSLQVRVTGQDSRQVGVTGQDSLQARVQRTIDDLVASGQETGIQVAAYLDGRMIVDACAGVADPATGRPVTADTPFFAYSTGKGLTSTVVHVLAERGALDHDLPIARVWPEFGRHGKDGVTLRHALTHSAGVPALPADVTPTDFTDWERMCRIVADSELRWAPGTATGYHVWTYGWLVGEVVRRVTGRTVSQVLAEEVTGPLGLAGELFLAVPGSELGRLARLVDGNWSAMLATMRAHLPHFDLAVPPAVAPDAAFGNRADLLRAELPAVGTVTARGMARLYAALIGTLDGVRLVSPGRLTELSTTQIAGVDWTLGLEIAWGLGYGVDPDGSFGTGGVGGSLAYAYPELGLTVAATKNRLSAGDGDPMEQLRVMIRDAVAGDGRPGATTR